MQKALRRLCLIPVLLLAFAAADQPRTASAQQDCWVNHWACPDGFYDCCCGVFQACLDYSGDCKRYCGP